MKKILLMTSDSIMAKTPTGYTLKNLFQGIDKEYLMNYFRYNRESNLLDYNVKNIMFSGYQFKFGNNEIERFSSNNLEENKKSFVDKFKRFIKKVIPMSINIEMQKDIEKFHPNEIYLQLNDIISIKLALKIVKKYKLDLCFHIMDDVFDIAKISNNSYNYKLLNKIFKLSKSVFCASPKMKKVLDEKFNIQSIFVTNAIEFDIRETNNNIDEKQFLYMGNLTPNRHINLSKLADKIDNYNSKNDTNYYLSIYAPDDQVLTLKNMMNKNILFNPLVNNDKARDIMANAFVLVHTESNLPDDIKFCKYSLSTKIAEYSSISKPILYFGPEEVGVADFLISNNIGSYIDLNNFDNFLDRLKDHEFYVCECENNYNNAKKILDAKQIRKVFQQGLL